MLFNSDIFILVFLPITLGLFLFLRGYGFFRLAIAVLVLASLFFYSWWDPKNIFIMISSLLFNYSWGRIITRSDRGKLFLVIGIFVNILLLSYYKYSYFLVENVADLTGLDFHIHKIILPIGISFFTFQQLAYLVDTYRGETKEYNFISYCLFVSFFPQLIAGPIVHHKEIIPQFNSIRNNRSIFEDFSIGTTIFVIGLFKKLIIADSLAKFADPTFYVAAKDIGQLSFMSAWLGAIAYSLQLYFDFSGYADMAIGLGRMFGIKLPLNFHSPYKSKNIIDFWRRWHITLSRFLRDYLYIPLGGNRKGKFKRYNNLLITMLLGGFWHGAGWTFLLWGGLHGVYLIINHAWHALVKKFSLVPISYISSFISSAITFLSVVFAWVLFRAVNKKGVINMYKAMLGLNGFSVSSSLKGHVPILGSYLKYNGFFHSSPVNWNAGMMLVIPCLLVVFFLPNTQECFARYNPALGLSDFDKISGVTEKMQFRPSILMSVLLGIIFSVMVIMLYVGVDSEFIYFQF